MSHRSSTKMSKRPALIFISKKITTNKRVQPGNTLINNDDNKNNNKEKKTTFNKNKKQNNCDIII